MTRIILITITLFFGYCIHSYAQQRSVTLDMSYGHSYGEGDHGYNFDTELGIDIFKRFKIGLLLHGLSINRQTNTRANTEFIIFETIEGGEISEGIYFREVRNYSQNHIGINIGYRFIDFKRLKSEFSFGYGYTAFDYLRVTENNTSINYPHVSQYSQVTDGYNRNWSLSTSIDIYKSMFFGTRVRLIEGPQYEMAINAIIGLRI